jgi:hypothetical protein
VIIAKGLLNSETRHDPGAVSEALYAHLDQTLGSTLWRETASSRVTGYWDSTSNVSGGETDLSYSLA